MCPACLRSGCHAMHGWHWCLGTSHSPACWLPPLGQYFQEGVLPLKLINEAGGWSSRDHFSMTNACQDYETVKPPPSAAVFYNEYDFCSHLFLANVPVSIRQARVSAGRMSGLFCLGGLLDASQQNAICSSKCLWLSLPSWSSQVTSGRFPL